MTRLIIPLVWMIVLLGGCSYVLFGGGQPIGAPDTMTSPGLPNVGGTPIPGLYATPDIVVPTP